MPGRRPWPPPASTPSSWPPRRPYAINGTQIMTAIACQAVYDARGLAKTADIAAAMTCQACTASGRPSIPRCTPCGPAGADHHGGEPAAAAGGQRAVLRPESGQGAGRLRHPLHAPDSRGQPGRHRLCVGRGKPGDQRRHRQPLIFPEEDEAISGGNFHGQPVAAPWTFWASPWRNTPTCRSGGWSGW